jgi:hypothetical protein
MSYTNVALKSTHMAGVKNVGNEPFGLAQSELPVKISHDSSSILASMLKHGKSIIDQLVDMDIVTSDYSNDAAHCFASTPSSA